MKNSMLTISAACVAALITSLVWNDSALAFEDHLLRSDGAGEGATKEAARAAAERDALQEMANAHLPTAAKHRLAAALTRLVHAYPGKFIEPGGKIVKESRSGEGAHRIALTLELPKDDVEYLFEQAAEFFDWYGQPKAAAYFVEKEGKTAGSKNSSVIIKGLEAAIAAASIELESVAEPYAQWRDARESDAKKKIPHIFVDGEIRATGERFNAESDLYLTDAKDRIASLNATGVTARSTGEALGDKVIDALFKEWGVWAYEGRVVDLKFQDCKENWTKRIDKTLRNLEDEEFLEIVKTEFAGDRFLARVRTTLPPHFVSDDIRHHAYKNGLRVRGLAAGATSVLFSVNIRTLRSIPDPDDIRDPAIPDPDDIIEGDAGAAPDNR
jgi:hypothetical protein